MIRVIFGLKKEKHTKMVKVCVKFKIMSVNQISVYHTLLESYNIIRNSSTEPTKCKWTDSSEKKYFIRSITNNDLRVPEKPIKKSQGFTYNAAKLFNMLPIHLRETQNPTTFKSVTEAWIWDNIPSY